MLIRRRKDIESPEDPCYGDVQRVSREMHADAYPPAEPEGKLEVSQSGVVGLEKAFRPKFVWGREHDGVAHDPTDDLSEEDMTLNAEGAHAKLAKTVDPLGIYLHICVVSVRVYGRPRSHLHSLVHIVFGDGVRRSTQGSDGAPSQCLVNQSLNVREFLSILVVG